MSEFVICETEITDLDALKAALVELGAVEANIEVHDEPVNLHGFGGDVREQKAHVVIRRKNVGGSSNDVGFEKVDGKYRVHVSQYDRGRGIGSRIYNELNQTYAKQQVLRVARRKAGCRITETQKDKDGKIRIKMRLG